METSQKVFVAPLLLALVALLILGGGAYVYTQNNQSTQSKVATSTAQTANTQTAKIYTIPQCGVKLTVKTNETVKTNKREPNQGGADFIILVGSNENKSRSGSAFAISCTAKDGDPERSWSNSVSNLLSVSASFGPDEVNKNEYRIFDAQTISEIDKLYLVRNSGPKSSDPDDNSPGPINSTLGFETQDWMYIIGFSYPEPVKNQDKYIISVVSPIPN